MSVIGPIIGLAGIALLAAPDAAWELPEANKLVVLVAADGCPLAQLGPRLDRAARRLAGNRHATRIVLDLPADPLHNADPLGRPSPIVATVEVSAPTASLPALALRTRGAMPAPCRSAAYFVHERRYLSNPRHGTLGEPSPAIKTITTLIRKDGTNAAAFDREWGGPHAQLTLAARKAAGEHGSHYVQNLVVGRADAASPALDGIGEGGSDGTGGIVATADRMMIAAHAATFTDMARSTMFVARETIVKDVTPANPAPAPSPPGSAPPDPRR
ncbi:MAG: hypothetical protein KGN34_17335 [Sphingomonadales bacterium]|nr:hypothetical protein [Sphingomonadales bacterium]